MATIELAKTLEDERIRTVTEDPLADATLARSQSIETSPAAQGIKAQLARPSPAEAPPLNSGPPHADPIGVYYLG